jgi:signal transduction histidine kinase
MILLAYRRQKKLTHHIEELNTTLEERITEALRKNKEQQAMMLHQDRLARMGEMIAMIAHQWRQPLNNLALTNQLLVSKYTKGKLDDEALAYFKENSKKQITQMSETIDDFRNFYKLEKEKVDFCVSDVVKELIDRTQIIFKDSGVKVTYTAEGCPMFHGYPNELKHAIQNIMSNARDALADKEEDKRQIDINVFEDDHAISIRIHDNAGGMPEEIKEKIFDPYFSTKDAKNGTGLGLYMANVIVAEHMNSEILLHADTEGTEFIIHLKKTAT